MSAAERLLKLFLVSTLAAAAAEPALVHAPYFSYEVDTTVYRAVEISAAAHTYEFRRDQSREAGRVTLSCLWLESGTDIKAWTEQAFTHIQQDVAGSVDHDYRFYPTKYSALNGLGCKLSIQTRQWTEVERIHAFLWHPDSSLVVSIFATGTDLRTHDIKSLSDSVILQRTWLHDDHAEAMLLAEALNQADPEDLKTRTLQLVDTRSGFRKKVSLVAWPVVVIFRCLVALGLLLSVSLVLFSIFGLPFAVLAGDAIQWRLCTLPLCLLMIWFGNLCDVPGGTGGDKTDDWTVYAIGESGKRYYWDPGKGSRPELYDDDLPALKVACNNFAYRVQADANVAERIVARVLDISIGLFRRERIVLQGPSFLWIDRETDSRYWEYGIYRDAWWGNWGHTLFRPAFTRAMYSGPECLPENIDDFKDPKLSAFED